MKSFIFHEVESSYLLEKKVSTKLKRAMSSARVAKPGQTSSISFNLSESVMENKGGITGGPISEIFMMSESFRLLKNRVNKVNLIYDKKSYTSAAAFETDALKKNKGKIKSDNIKKDPAARVWIENGIVQGKFFAKQLEEKYEDLGLLEFVTLQHAGIDESGTSKSDVNISWKLKDSKKLA